MSIASQSIIVTAILPSLTPDKLLRPDFKVCTQNYAVETEPKWSVGHTDEWQYKTKEEENDGI